MAKQNPAEKRSIKPNGTVLIEQGNSHDSSRAESDKFI
jgi:hypothetical protein